MKAPALKMGVGADADADTDAGGVLDSILPSSRMEKT